MSVRLNIVSALVLVALLESAHGGVMRKRRDNLQHGLQMSSSHSSHSSASATSILSSIMEDRRPQAAVARDASAPRHHWQHHRRMKCHNHPHQGSYPHQPEHQHRHQLQLHRCNHWTQHKYLHPWRRPVLNGRGPI